MPAGPADRPGRTMLRRGVRRYLSFVAGCVGTAVAANGWFRPRRARRGAPTEQRTRPAGAVAPAPSNAQSHRCPQHAEALRLRFDRRLGPLRGVGRGLTWTDHVLGGVPPGTSVGVERRLERRVRGVGGSASGGGVAIGCAAGSGVGGD